MENLPNEIVEVILKSPALTMKDVVTFGSTCCKYRDLVNLTYGLWKTKYYQCWASTDSSLTPLENWRTETKSLTDKYYGKILLKFISKKYYSQAWTDLLNLESRLQTLEKGAIFVNNWFEENKVDVSMSVRKQLNCISDLVKKHLLQHYKEHPLKGVPDEKFLLWETENIPDNMFSPDESIAIIQSINHILFEYLNYYIHYNVDHIERMKCCIEQAMTDKLTTSLIFAVIYESVARRVGVKIEIFQFSNHSLLSWKESYRVENAPSHYISMSNRGKFMRSGQCPFSPHFPLSNLVSSSSKIAEIAHTAACNMWVKEVKENNFPLMNALDLVLIVSPPSFHIYQELGWSYMQHSIDVDLLVSKLLEIKSDVAEERQRFQHLLASLVIYQTRRLHERKCPRDISPKFRTEDVAFAVGMIIRDKRSGCPGVICGWCPFHVENSPPQIKYFVLVDGGDTVYLAQEDLQILHSPPLISHPGMGRYFEEYLFSYYKPNRELQAEYPQDLNALPSLLKNDRESKLNAAVFV
ncbi:hypothetical protein RUM44_008734 [Polyplax serrata]|uniref:Hemimethylated DNA-binding domain-containing protein n=1 Tax=Polyplax serrata TaxID=468196 RepID=A0ABR1BDJ0_POLSC